MSSAAWLLSPVIVCAILLAHLHTQCAEARTSGRIGLPVWSVSLSHQGATSEQLILHQRPLTFTGWKSWFYVPPCTCREDDEPSLSKGLLLRRFFFLMVVIPAKTRGCGIRPTAGCVRNSLFLISFAGVFYFPIWRRMVASVILLSAASNSALLSMIARVWPPSKGR